MSEQNEINLKDAILKILIEFDERDRGWYYGSEEIQDELYVQYKLSPTMKEIKVHLRALKAENLAITQPIFSEDGKLNGSGWFFNYYKYPNGLKEI